MQTAGPEIETARLRLRMFTPDDAETFYRIWHDPHVLKYIDQNWNPTLEDVRATMTRQIERWRERGFGQWVIVLKDEERIIGYIGFKFLADTPEVELLYGIEKPYWNRGYTTEAGRACLRFIFENTDQDRIVAVADPENVASWSVMEKLGMRRERVAHYYNKELVYYAILKEQG